MLWQEQKSRKASDGFQKYLENQVHRIGFKIRSFKGERQRHRERDVKYYF
jgi:hypothetical protein